MAAKPRSPAGLKAAGRRLWSQVTDQLELRPDERSLLEVACRTADELARLQEALADASSLMVKGSTGQPRVHPALDELRRHRALLAALLKQLDIPEEPAESEPPAEVLTPRQASARRRWANRRREQEARGGP